MPDKLSQFSAINLSLPKLLIRSADIDNSESLLKLINSIQNNFKALSNNSTITQFDELHLLGITQDDVEKRICELYESVKSKNDLKPTELIALGELIGELNALNRYSKSLSYHQNINKKAKKIGLLKNVKTLTYQQVASEYYQNLSSNSDYIDFDSWAIIAGVDKFLRGNLDPKFLISKQKSTQKLANYIGVSLNRGKRSKAILSQCETVHNYLRRNFSSDCFLIYNDLLKANYQDIYGIPLPEEDRRLGLAFIAIKKLASQVVFQNLKRNVSLNILVNKLLKGLEGKFGVKSFDARTEIIYISQFYSKIPYYEPFYYQNNRKPMKLGLADSGRLDELIFNVFKQTNFL